MPTEAITQDVADTIKQVFPGLGDITLQKVLYAALVLVVCALLIKLFLQAFDRGMGKLKVDRGLQSFVRSGLQVLMWFVAALIVAGLLDIPTSSLLAVLGVVGLAISLSIQSTLSNLAAGIVLLVSKPFKVGDYVEVGGVGGTVEEIGLVHTQMATIDNKRIFVPSSEILAKQITNYSAESNRRVDMTFSVNQDAAPERVKQTILDVVAAHPKTLFTPEPFVGLMAYREGCAEYVLRVWTANADYWTVYFALMEQVKAALDQAGISMRFSHQNVRIIKD